MGFDFGSLTKVLLGAGLGILAVSCLTVTICFGRVADKTSTLDYLEAKIKNNYSASLYDCSVAIAVMGCFAFVAALTGIVLSLLLGGQKLVLIIVTGVTAAFAFGCIVAEGVYSQRCYQNDALSENNIINYQHKSAEKYIKKSIEDLYKQAVSNFNDNPNAAGIKINSWSNIKDRLGKEKDSHVFGYGDLWDSDYSRRVKEKLNKKKNKS